MDGHGEARANAMMKCAEAAWDMGLKIFALQNGGECMGERDGERKYMKYGMSNLCHGQYCMEGSHCAAKNGLMKTGLNNVLLPTLFNAVNNIV